MQDYIHPEVSSVEIKMADGIFVKSMHCHERLTLIPQHAHSYDHLSMLARGRVMVWKDDECLGEFVAPVGIFIAARAKHKFITLEPDTLIYCIHNIKDAEEVSIAEEHEMTADDIAKFGVITE